MVGAEALVRSLIASNLDVCFTNPGTSEMHFVGALDRVREMRCVLALFEGVATGAADGYGRMTGRPASTLLHLGPGLANGIANLHNARRANTPIVNIVGEHATYHRRFDPPLHSDIDAVAARAFVAGCKVERIRGAAGADAAPRHGRGAGAGAASARCASRRQRLERRRRDGRHRYAPAARRRSTRRASRDAARHAARKRRGAAAERADAAGEAPELCGRVAAATGAELLAPTQIPRIERGAGRVTSTASRTYRAGAQAARARAQRW